MTTKIGTLQIAPVATAVITAYLAVSGTGTLMVLARRDATAVAPGQSGRDADGSAPVHATTTSS